MILANFEQHHSDSFQAFQTIAVIAQMGSVIGVLIKSKIIDVKRVASSAAVTGIFGITEPSMYGINLRFKKPFIIACISGAIGAFVASFFSPKYYAYAGLPGPITVINGYSSSNPTSIWGILIGSAIAIILPIILIQIFGYGDDTTQEVENDADINNNQINQPFQETLETTISSPMNGVLIPLSDVNDPIFSQEMMGKGIAIKSEENTVHSPIKGTISMVTPTKHAIGLTSDDGIEILIHIGLDTVKLNGKGYELLVQENDKVDVGIPLINFDNATITKQGFDIITPLIITNSDEFSDIIPTKKSNVVEKESILTIIKK